MGHQHELCNPYRGGKEQECEQIPTSVHFPSDDVHPVIVPCSSVADASLSALSEQQQQLRKDRPRSSTSLR